MNYKRPQTGSVVIYAILVLGVILGITITLVQIFIPKIRIANNAVNSAVAIGTADSASELCLYEVRKNITITRPIMQNGSTFSIKHVNAGEADISNNCAAIASTSFSFRAIGEYRNITRALEVTQ